MGQKVNPHGLRVGVIQDWDAKWIADKNMIVIKDATHNNFDALGKHLYY